MGTFSFKDLLPIRSIKTSVHRVIIFRDHCHIVVKNALKHLETWYNVITFDKGKPFERMGRKTKGSSSIRDDSQFPKRLLLYTYFGRCFLFLPETNEIDHYFKEDNYEYEKIGKRFLYLFLCYLRYLLLHLLLM